jgi:quercetin dioxygenase-like cupin family protein
MRTCIAGRSTSLFAAALLAAHLSACAAPRPPAPVATPTTSTGEHHEASTTVAVSGQCELRRTGPADAVGCYMTGSEQLGVVSSTPLYWHLDRYPTLEAARAARQGHGTVAEAHGRVWLFTIAEVEWRPLGGERVARVGPLPLTARRAYTAYYIEGVVPPGARTPPHRHAGPEAWYVLEGTNCLETPEGVRTAGAGQSLIVPEGPPMVLTGVGPTTRRSMAVVVHDAAQPWTILSTDWTPKGACQRMP